MFDTPFTKRLLLTTTIRNCCIHQTWCFSTCKFLFRKQYYCQMIFANKDTIFIFITTFNAKNFFLVFIKKRIFVNFIDNLYQTVDIFIKTFLNNISYTYTPINLGGKKLLILFSIERHFF